MAFVVSAGALRAVDRPLLPAIYALRLSQDVVSDYGTLWRTQPELRTVVDFLARNIAQLGLHVFRRVSDVDRQRQPTHPLARLLERPNSFTTRYRLIDHLVHDICVYDEAYWLKVRDDAGLASLRRLRPQRVWPTGEDWMEPDGFRIVGSKGTLDVGATDVVWFRGYNPHDDRAGTPPIESLRRILAEEYAANVYREQLWRNSARVGGYLKRPVEAPDWSDKARDRFRDGWQAQWAGDSNTAGGTPILEDGMDFVPAATSPRDAQYVESKRLTREEVARAFHVPLPMVGILDHATFCLPGHALVETERGPRSIARVRRGDRVWSLVDGELQLRPITSAGQTGIKPLLTIRTQNRTLQCTDNHPVLVRRRTRTDESAHKNRRRYTWEHAWTPAGDVRVGDIVVTLAELPESGGDTCPTRHVSEGFAEFCGLLLGDGNVMRSGGKLLGVAVARASNAGYMDHYRAIMREEFRCASMGGVSIAALRDARPITLVESERATRFASVGAASELHALGLSGTAHTKQVPCWVFGLSVKLRLAFLRGFLDADGSVDKKGRISYSSVNEDMLRQVRQLCIGVGVPVTNIRCQRGTTKLPSGQTATIAQWTFTCSDPGANRMIGSHDPRYQERLAAGQAFGEGAYQTRYYAYPDRTGRVPLRPPRGCGHARVVRIERSQIAVPVYDLTVSGSHNFIAEGVIVHNSNIREQHKNLYADCLGPWLEMIQQEIEVQLMPDMPDNANLYVEFNINEKLRGSFEEQAAQLSSGVGAPYMTRNEARARLNLPQIDGADDLVVPLNVAMSGGGPAAPADVSGEAARPARLKRHVKARAPLADTAHANTALSEFFRRQGRSVASALGAAKGHRSKADVADVFDADRWNEQLARLLKDVNGRLASAAAVATLAALGADPTEFDPAIMDGWLEAEAGGVAAGINAVTAAQLADALAGDDPLGAVKHLFEVYASARAAQIAVTQTTAMSGFGSVEAGKHAAGDDATKTWITGANPRAAHAQLSGQTVGLHEQFSNGARWPGDSSLGSEDICGCNCQLVINA